jgi:hypothetical protein
MVDETEEKGRRRRRRRGGSTGERRKLACAQLAQPVCLATDPRYVKYTT